MILSTLLAATLMMAEGAPTAVPSDITAAPPAPMTATQVKKAETTGSKVICKSESVTGSLMPKKTCYTVDQLEQRKQDERANLERIQQQSH